MRILLFLLGSLALLGAGFVLSRAESAIHEIEAFILLLVSSVLISGAAVVEAVNTLRKEMANTKNQSRIL